jgi:predicted membrane protein
MKKYIMIAVALVLTACATTSPHALSVSLCPNGDEPTKTVSADGSYYVWVCAGSGSSSNGLLPDTLKQIKVVKDWEPITNHLALKNYVSKTSVNQHKIQWNAKYNCIDRITYAKQISNKWFHKNSMIWAHCAAYVHMAGTKNPQVVGDILLAWASADKDPIVWRIVVGDFSSAGYQLPSTIGTFSQFYALWYNEIAYTPEERKRVDDYMTMKLMKQQFPVLKSDDKGRYRKCNINDINNPIRERTDSNNCGNTRMKVAVGEIMLGFRLENQTLLDKGHDDMYVVNAFINKDGININHAAKGANTVNYSWEYTYYYSILAEIYRSVGYDFFEHTLPRGAKVHEYIAFNYRLLKDFTLTSQWAGAKPGMNGRSYNKIKNLSQAEFQKSDYGHNVIDWNNRDKLFVKAHKRFVSIYMPHLNTDVTYFDMTHNSHTMSANIGVDAYMIYHSNTSPVEKVLPLKVMDYSLTPKAGDGWRKHYKNVSSN